MAKVRNVLFKKNIKISNAANNSKNISNLFGKFQSDRTVNAQFGPNADSCKYQKYRNFFKNNIDNICEEID